MSLYMGKMLRVDLTSEKIWTEDLNDEWARDYIGGKGLGLRYLFHVSGPKVDPLSPENALILMTGPLAGTTAPGSSRVCITTKSPATGTFLDSHMGGGIGAEIKYAGYDGIIITGKASTPVYLCITDDTVAIEDAQGIWGLGVFDAEKELDSRLPESDYQNVLIGQAGEHQVPFACLTSCSYRQAGRGGAGAVMGSKNLKAIAVKGTKGVGAYDMGKFLDLSMALQKEAVAENNEPARDNVWVIREGSPFLLDVVNDMGILPVKNFQDGQWPNAKKINSEALQKFKSADRACVSCPLACGKFVVSGDNIVEGPEYETLALGGANCGIDDMRAIIAFNEACDDLGLDTMSTGNVIGFAMEMTEKGIYDFDVHFGDVGNYLKIPAEIAFKEGRGLELAMGVRRLSKKYGGQEFAMESKGLEFPGYDPRGAYGMGLAYAVSDRGACHLRAFAAFVPETYDIDINVEAVKEHHQRLTIKDCVTSCFFHHHIHLKEMADLLNTGLGSHYNDQGLRVTGERVWNLSRLFNLHAGLTAADDSLPKRIFKDKLATGPHAGRLLPHKDFMAMRQSYYSKMGWDDEGVPLPDTLEKLGLKEFICDTNSPM
jgi:aldehyde:ferredoxin oxidoreductase